MRNYLTMDGVTSRTFGVYINGVDTFGAPAREVSTLQIPGRNGDIIVKADRLQNYDLTYSAFIYRNFDANIAALRAFLLSKTSYFRLEDTYHPDEYRMAYFRGPFTPAVTQRLNAAKFDLTFNVKPQRFLISGTQSISISDGQTVINITRFDARPLLRVYGSGSIRFGTGSTLTIAPHDNNYIDIDCDTMEAYYRYGTRNQYVSSSDTDFPRLTPGGNVVHISGLTSVTMTPRWWTV